MEKKQTKPDIERVSTGINGMDDLMEGGFIRGSTNLVAGYSGTCKTIFGCQYLWDGVQKGEPGVYITLEESASDIISDVTRFGWDFQKAIDEKKCRVAEMKSIDMKELKVFVADEVKSIGAKRFVLDSLSIAAMSWRESPDETFRIRMELFDMLKSLKNLNITSMLISEVQRGQETLGRFGFEEFLVDGVLMLQLMVTDVPMRSMQIMKMRRTNHSVEVYPFSVTGKGIVLKKI